MVGSDGDDLSTGVAEVNASHAHDGDDERVGKAEDGFPCVAT
ncbi:hypothetical protein SAMN04515678_11348 [Roseivivax sediminis]|uniref:Uncharacterized protein n=1 Tax=Roseivivax sediminis TaxID=936889 RepID=A0A1I2CDU3_9RHOB|nr:hypothetical protein SAMN04515678_11348 [Roseivivax sediminis]